MQYSDDCRCWLCGKTYHEHLHGEFKHDFRLLQYAILSGDMTDSERSQIVKIYNSPANITGRLISCLFISKVASSGVSFFNTNHLILLSRVSNLSLWKQIKARIMRLGSHELLPPEKRFANIYTMILKPEENYYKVRSLLYKDTLIITQKIYDYSITKTLFDKPETFQTNYKDVIMLRQDIFDEIRNIYTSGVIDFNINDIIDFEKYATMIRKYSKNICAIDFSKFPRDYIKTLILRIENIDFITEQTLGVDSSTNIYLYNNNCVPFQNYSVDNSIPVGKEIIEKYKPRESK
jgi:hypothetical protein